ncbi:MAG: Gfo/Idh/MocA family oxidoreductase [Candidatus Bathyarchaeia archaeon]
MKSLRSTLRLLNVGIVGAGSRARSHISVLLKLRDKYRLVAVCDVDVLRAKSVADNVGVKAYDDLEKMLSEEKLDACLIAVQAEGHHVVANTLAQKGIHILTETPIAITVACADYMIKAARENGVLLEVSENVPRWPQERLKQKIVADGILGEVKSFYLSYVSGSYHGIAAIRSILKSEVKSVVGVFPPLDSILEKAEINLLNGITGVYEFNRNRGNYWEINGTEASLKGSELCFRNGQTFKISIETSVVDGCLRVVGAKVSTKPELFLQTPLSIYPLTDYDEVAIADAWISLYNAIVYGKPLNYGFENAKRDLEVLMAIRESEMLNGVRVDLPLEGITTYEKTVHEEFAKVYGLDPLELNPQHLKTKYVLPKRLWDLMYYGRVLQQ